MGNCLRVFEILRAATSQPTENDDDATLLDPGNYGENLAIPVDESEESDESPLFFRMLSKRGVIIIILQILNSIHACTFLRVPFCKSCQMSCDSSS